MAKKNNSDNLKVEGGNKETGFSDDFNRITDMELSQDAFWDDEDGEDFCDDNELTPEEEETFNRIIRNALEREIEYYTRKGEDQGPAVFSERYENNLKETLERTFGEAEAAQILQERADARQEKAEELTRFYKEKLEAIPEPKYTLWEKMGKMWRKRWVRTAAACICIVFVISITALNADALKVPIARFFAEDEPEYVVLNPESENDAEAYPTTIEKKFAPEKVLDGYEEVMREEVSKSIRIVYQNAEGTDYQFVQETRDMYTWADNENVNSQKYDTVFGDAYCYEKDSIYKLVWQYEGYIFKIEGNLKREEMVGLANSLRLEQ